MIRNPGKIAKPPRKVAAKKEAEASVQTRKVSKGPLRKEKAKCLDQTDFTQNKERSETPSKSEVKTLAEMDTDATTNKYYMNFDFYFKRTSFRTMTHYFKTAFKAYFERWKTERKKTSIAQCLTEFSVNSFPGLFDSLNDVLKGEFVELLKLLVFSHRHNKNDAFLQNPLVDFAIVREPMYKYSRAAQEKFFDYPTFAFLFAWFSHSPDARKFSDMKFAENEDARYPARMFQEIHFLGSEALEHLRRSANVIDSKLP
jgi:hypothetical protein